MRGIVDRTSPGSTVVVSQVLVEEGEGVQYQDSGFMLFFYMTKLIMFFIEFTFDTFLD